MKVVEGAKVWQCDHCGKKSHHGSSLSRHEKFCPKKPENQHQCFKWCKHLVKDIELDESGTYAAGKSFSCAITKSKMWSYKLERSIYNNSLAVPPTEDMVRMPITCPHYQDQNPGWDAYPEPTY